MEKLNTIQKHHNLNDVCRLGEEGPGGAYHTYGVLLKGAEYETTEDYAHLIEFQRGPRSDENSRHGVTNEDLLEIVRDRLKCFQKGDYATRENENALIHIEEALMWLNKRAEDRAERGVLGTMNK